jgi:thiol-disulfide isomerase/thioredoxin
MDKDKRRGTVLILITAKNCQRCREMKEKLEKNKKTYIELELTVLNTADTITKLRINNIFKQEMPILIEEDKNGDWEEVTI